MTVGERSRCAAAGTLFRWCRPLFPVTQGVIMSVAGESGGRAQQMRQKAQEMEQAAERATDPDERQRLKEKARRLKEQSEQQGGTGSGDPHPMM
jgi:hypothetical protein